MENIKLQWDPFPLLRFKKRAWILKKQKLIDGHGGA